MFRNPVFNLRTDEKIKTPKVEVMLVPLVVQLRTQINDDSYNKRLEQLKEQYGGPVVLLKAIEQITN